MSRHNWFPIVRSLIYNSYGTPLKLNVYARLTPNTASCVPSVGNGKLEKLRLIIATAFYVWAVPYFTIYLKIRCNITNWDIGLGLANVGLRSWLYNYSHIKLWIWIANARATVFTTVHCGVDKWLHEHNAYYDLFIYLSAIRAWGNHYF